jgi:UDPglucose 6-dehydrogenase
MASHDHSEETMKIGVIGVGRLGICFALLLDRAGHDVMASDIRTNYVAALNRGEIHTQEPGVADLLSNKKSIQFTTDTRAVIQHSDVIYVMVATPSAADGSYDVSAVDRVVEDVADCEFDISHKILVIGCTTNPGDCQRVQDRLRSQRISVLYNPEFIAQGSIIRDLQQADMVLIGGENPAVISAYQLLYDDIQTVKPNVHAMSLTAAELVKIATNCFLTTKISYANLLGEVMIRSGLESDVDKALAAVGADTRIGSKYMRYGYGYGGPCLPRDNRAFAHYAHRVGLDFPLGTIVDQFNRDHTQFIIDDLIRQNTQDLPFYTPSLTYKPNTDIVEESQQLAVCEGLLAQGKTVYVRYSELLPVQVQQDLEQRFGDRVRFVPIDDPVLRDTNLFGILL